MFSHRRLLHETSFSLLLVQGRLRSNTGNTGSCLLRGTRAGRDEPRWLRRSPAGRARQVVPVGVLPARQQPKGETHLNPEGWVAAAG